MVSGNSWRILKQIGLWAKDDRRRFVIVIIAFAFISFVIIPRVSRFLINFDYIGQISSFWESFYSFSNSRESLVLLYGAILIIVLRGVSRTGKNSKRAFDINVEKQSDMWSYYKGSGWSIIEDNESWNKVLKLTNCHYPAILKFGNEWVNYNFSFEAKVPASVLKQHQNFAFVIRARDKGNSVFFQCRPDGTITPHFITNGLLLVDKKTKLNF